MRADRWTLVGIALVCWANLLTFMALGLAMFGVAASGVYVFLRGDKILANVQRELRVHAQWST